MKLSGIPKAKSRLIKFLMLAMVFVVACITSIDGVQITGLFADAAGQIPADAGDAHGVVYFGVNVQFSFNPNFFEDNPPHPQDRIAISFRLGSGQPIPGAFDTTLVPDGDYTVIAAAAPFGGFDSGYGESGPFPITIRNQRPQIVQSPPAPGPLDGGDDGAPPPLQEPAPPPPPMCKLTGKTGNTEASRCPPNDPPDPDNKDPG